MTPIKTYILIILCVSPIILEAQICNSRNYNATWDWRETTYTFYTNDYPGPHKSPWYAVYSNNPNIDVFRTQIEKDYDPEDGWVLVQRDFGEENRPINHPYFILYNKYTGILRIFVAITKVYGQNQDAQISLTYAGGSIRTAILENHTEQRYRNALDNFDNDVKKIIVPNDYSADLPFWLHADFIMNYDPCTCNSLQKLFFDVSLITTSTLTFDLNGQAIQQIDSAGKRGSGSRQSLTKTAKGTIDAGTSFFKSTEKGLDALQKIFPSINYAENPLYNIVPGLGAAAGVVDFLAGVFNNKSPDVKPLVFDINMTATGELKSSNPHKPIILENPGSDNLTLIPPTALEYNNIMGVFNLIETPVIGYRERDCVIVEPTYDIVECEYDYKLKSDIKYVINPEIDIDYSTLDIKVSYGGSQFVPLSCINEIVESFTAWEGITPFAALKFFVSFKTFSGNDVVYLSTYNTIMSNEKYNNQFWSGGSLSLPTNSIISGSNITNVPGNEIAAWNSIEISNSTINTNEHVNIIAGKQVRILPQTTLVSCQLDYVCYI